MKSPSRVLAAFLSLTLFAADLPAQSSRAKTRATVPVFSMSAPVTEAPGSIDSPFNFGAMPVSLKDVIDRLNKAKEDERVPAIVLYAPAMGLGRGQLQELTQALNQFKESGKKIHVHADTLSTGSYALLSAASDVSMVPTGYLFITGLYGEQMYLRGMFDKVGIQPDFFTRGDYKSAAEMYMRKGPSPAAREMYKWLYDSVYDTMIEDIAFNRSTDAATVRAWIDEGLYTAERAKQKGIIDRIEHRQQFEARLRDAYGELKFDRRYGRKSTGMPDLSSPFGLIQFYSELLAPSRSRKSTKDAVAIVYLEGAIMEGSGGDNPFLMSGAAFSEPIRKALDEVAEDDSIKAVVFRVNSPGGSAVASEVILNATRRVAEKKPFIVSMGDVAGSGGYYVACGTDTIFADEATITGSIGVVAGKLATTQAWDKIGIHWKPIQRGKNSGMLGTSDIFSPSEREAMSRYMDDVYGVFKGHVVSARGKRLAKPIDELAGGRVFSGAQALELGLVDKIGGLTDAVEFAGKKANLEEYEIRVVPKPKNFMEVLMAGMTGEDSDDSGHLSLGSTTATSMLGQLMPVIQRLDPQRAKAVLAAMRQLSVLDKEHVTLTMPIFVD